MVCVTVFYLSKELWDDLKRRKGDKVTNNLEYELVFTQNEAKVQWRDLKVGTIIKLNQNDVVPADLVLLARQSPSDEVYIRTD
jgi:magnesium-transporting ATPase (P-type)